MEEMKATEIRVAELDKIDELLEKSRRGTLTDEDKALYRSLISNGHVVDTKFLSDIAGCPKCGAAAPVYDGEAYKPSDCTWCKVIYDKDSDLMTVVCAICGHEQTALPMDRKDK